MGSMGTRIEGPRRSRGGALVLGRVPLFQNGHALDLVEAPRFHPVEVDA